MSVQTGRFPGSFHRADRSEHDGGFAWQDPLLRSCDCNRATAAVPTRIAGPKHLPSVACWRGEYRLRGGTQNLAFSKVYDQQPVIALGRKISEDKTGRAQHRAINCG